MITDQQRQKRQAYRQARDEQKARIEAGHAEAQQALADNRCPDCGSGVHVNLALTGWVQCDRSGSGHFRRDLTGEPCNWQGFTR